MEPLDPPFTASLSPGPALPLPIPGPSEALAGDEPPNNSVEVDLDKHASGIIPQLQNVVSTCYLGQKLDLKHIAMHARNAEYNPKRFAAVIMRIRDPKTTALIFSSGKMVCTGAKSETDSRLAARKYARIIQKLGFDEAKFQDFKIQNIVGSCDVSFPIRLEGLQHKHSIFAHYEPELFPGLIYRMKKPKVVLLIFVSGKVVLTGAKHRDEIYEAFEMIYPALREFRKGDAQQGLKAPLAPGNTPSASEPKRVKHEAQSAGLVVTPQSPESSMMHTSSPSHMLPPPTPWGNSLPPPTPSYGGLPPATPLHSLLPSSPSHIGLPPPTPGYKFEPQSP